MSIELFIPNSTLSLSTPFGKRHNFCQKEIAFLISNPFWRNDPYCVLILNAVTWAQNIFRDDPDAIFQAWELVLRDPYKAGLLHVLAHVFKFLEIQTSTFATLVLPTCAGVRKVAWLIVSKAELHNHIKDVYAYACSRLAHKKT